MFRLKIVIAGALLALVLAGCQAKPAAPVATASVPHNYIVFFRFDSADLTPDAHKVVDQAAAAIKDLKPSTVSLAGFTDQDGTTAHNLHLSERRVAAVEQELAMDGVDPKLVLRIPLGESEAALEGTADRRIEIRIIASR